MTKTWFRHRFMAELSFSIGMALMGTLVAIELFVGAEATWVKSVASFAFFVVGLYLAYTKPRIFNGFSGVNSTPPFALGDTIDWEVLGYDPWTISVVYKQLTAFGWRMRFAIDRADGKARTETAGHDGYIFDVALDRLTTLQRPLGHDGVWKVQPAPVRSLFVDGAITGLTQVSPCAEAGRCLMLSPDCARHGRDFKDQDDPVASG